FSHAERKKGWQLAEGAESPAAWVTGNTVYSGSWQPCEWLEEQASPMSWQCRPTTGWTCSAATPLYSLARRDRPIRAGSPKAAAHYASSHEALCGTRAGGRLAPVRTQLLVLRFLPPAPAAPLEVGGGPGTSDMRARLYNQGRGVLAICPTLWVTVREKGTTS